jgi:hypothetical protein
MVSSVDKGNGKVNGNIRVVAYKKSRHSRRMKKSTIVYIHSLYITRKEE